MTDPQLAREEIPGGGATFFRHRGFDHSKLFSGLFFIILWVDGLCLRGWMDISSSPLGMRFLWWTLLVIAPLVAVAALHARSSSRHARWLLRSPLPAARLNGSRRGMRSAEARRD